MKPTIFLLVFIGKSSIGSILDQVPQWSSDDLVQADCPRDHSVYPVCAHFCENHHQWRTLRELENSKCGQILPVNYEILLRRKRGHWPVNASEVRDVGDRQSRFLVDFRFTHANYSDPSAIDQVTINPTRRNHFCRWSDYAAYEVSMDDFECSVTTGTNRCSALRSFTNAEMRRWFIQEWPKDIWYEGLMSDRENFIAHFNVTQHVVANYTRALRDGLLIERRNAEGQNCVPPRDEPGWVEVIDRAWISGSNWCGSITDCYQCQTAINCDWCLTPSYQYKCVDYCLDPWKANTTCDSALSQYLQSVAALLILLLSSAAV